MLGGQWQKATGQEEEGEVGRVPGSDWERSRDIHLTPPMVFPAPSGRPARREAAFSRRGLPFVLGSLKFQHEAAPPEGHRGLK